LLEVRVGIDIPFQNSHSTHFGVGVSLGLMYPTSEKNRRLGYSCLTPSGLGCSTHFGVGVSSRLMYPTSEKIGGWAIHI